MSEPIETTRDTLFGGRLALRQPAKGHRAGTDAVLLAATVWPDFVGRVYDVGAASGAVGLGVAVAVPGAEVTLIERDAGLAALANENVSAAELTARVAVANIDITDRAARQPLLGGADLVLSNPPFYESGAVRLSPEAGRRDAHVLAEGGLKDWLDACLAFLNPRGTLTLIHRADALPQLLTGIGGRLGDLTVLPVYPRAGEPASRILLRGRKGSRAPFKIAPRLVLHDERGFTPPVAALHDGTGAIDW